MKLEEDSNLFNLSITGEGNKTLNRVQEFQVHSRKLLSPGRPDDNDLPIDGATPGVFVFDTAVAFQPFWDEVTLSEKIYFKPSDWVSTMKKEETFFGPNGPETFVNTRPMGVWSNDTFQWYDISAAALNDPDLSDPEPEDDAVGCPDNIFALADTDSCRGEFEQRPMNTYRPVTWMNLWRALAIALPLARGANLLVCLLRKKRFV